MGNQEQLCATTILKNGLEHEKGANSLVGVEGTASRSAMVFLMEPLFRGIDIHPEGE